jgi:hypothetical protein
MIEEKIKMAAKLYQCRDSAKFLHGKEYKRRMEDYGKYIYAYMAKQGVDELQAAINLCTEVKDMDGAGMFTMNIFAAAIELIEPS